MFVWVSFWSNRLRQRILDNHVQSVLWRYKSIAFSVMTKALCLALWDVFSSLLDDKVLFSVYGSLVSDCNASGEDLFWFVLLRFQCAFFSLRLEFSCNSRVSMSMSLCTLSFPNSIFSSFESQLNGSFSFCRLCAKYVFHISRDRSRIFGICNLYNLELILGMI